VVALEKDKGKLIMHLIFRSSIYLAAFILPIVLIGTAGLVRSVETSIPRPADTCAAELVLPPAPPYDASKPTVAPQAGAPGTGRYHISGARWPRKVVTKPCELLPDSAMSLGNVTHNRDFWIIPMWAGTSMLLL
jgi:hypothetical protein